MNKIDLEVFLTDILTDAKDSYYNKGCFLALHDLEQNILSNIDIGKSPIMTDALFDKVEQKLKELNPNSVYFTKVGSPVSFDKAKAALPVPMPSLDKIKPGTGDVDKWAAKYPGPYLISSKLDGVSVELDYRGESIKAYTRGDGVIGQDISYLVPYLYLPSIFALSQFPCKIFRGEIIMSKEKFSKWADSFENARNLVAGAVARKEIHRSLSDIDVVIYQVLDKDATTVPSRQLEELSNLFNIVPYRVCDTVTDELLSAALALAKTGAYEVDGLVITQNRVNPLTSDNPDYSRAFKEDCEEDIAEAEVLDVFYSVSKHGKLAPVLQISPIKLSGVTISSVTAYNAKYVVDNCLGPGAKIRIIRSGGVIPKVLEVVVPADSAKLPSGDWSWNETGVDAIVSSRETNSEVQLKRIVSFFTTLGTDLLGEGNLRKIYEAGYTTTESILKVTVQELLQIPGFKITMATRIREQLDTCLHEVDMATMADATGFFGRGLGTRKFKALLKHLPELVRWKDAPVDFLFTEAEKVPGFSVIMATQFAEGLRPFLEWTVEMGVTFKAISKVDKPEGRLSKEVITFTGFRDATLMTEAAILGAEVVDFSSRTTILVYSGKENAKVIKARKSGIRVMNRDTFESTVIKE